jgi:hypothetical protein
LPANTTIHLLAGTYQTYGVDSWSVKSGQKISGSGMDVTILQLSPSSPSNDPQPTIISSINNTTNVEVSDLTLDDNGSAVLGKAKLSGIYLCGTRHAIRRVKVINATSSGGAESFGIVIADTANGNATVNSDGNIIEECEVSQFIPGSGGCSAISFNGNGPTSGTIRNNRVFLTLNPQPSGGLIAINGSAIHDVLVEGNYVDGANVGYYGDTDGSTNVIVVHNTFRNCMGGVSLMNNVRQNITFAYNTILLSTNNPVLAIGIDILGEWNGISARATNINIIGNMVGWAGQPAPGRSGWFLSLDCITGLIVANNTVDGTLMSGAATNQIGSQIVNGIFYNNYDLMGNFLTTLNQVASPNGVTRRTVMYPGTGIYTNYVSYADKYIGVKGIPSGPRSYAVYIVLPSAVGYAGKDFIVADESGQLVSVGPGGKFISIQTTSPDRINGGMSITNFTPYAAMNVISDGTNWFAH